MAAVAGAVLSVLVVVAALPAVAQVPSPARITVEPPCTSTETPVGSVDVTVSGEQFNPFTAVIVAFDAGPGGRPESATARTDGFGRFRVTLRPSPRPPGSYLIRADDLRQREATTTTLVAPCPPPPDDEPVGVPPDVGGNQLDPTLVLRPAIGPPGFVTLAVGSGFPPNAPVALAWSLGITARGTTVVTGADGAFRLPVLVFHHDRLGRRALRAAPAGDIPFPAATADFLVVPGRAQPLDFRTRR